MLSTDVIQNALLASLLIVAQIDLKRTKNIK